MEVQVNKRSQRDIHGEMSHLQLDVLTFLFLYPSTLGREELENNDSEIQFLPFSS